MDNIELFGTSVPIRTNFCQFFDQIPEPINEPYVNVYIRSKFCNAKCKFCIWANDASLYNEEKYLSFLKEVSSKIKIRKIAFTGGEPTLNFNRFKRVVRLAKEYSPESYFSVNTDGLRLKTLFNDDIIDIFDSVALSRHHYDDNLNNEIFDFKCPSTDDLKEIKDLDKNDILHFSCNLIKGYIDTSEKIYQYLDFANDIGVDSVGFVSLMPVNEYSKEKFIDFNIKDLINEKFNLTKEWKYKNMCKCNNYVYIPDNLKTIIKVYHKNTFNPFDIVESLIFDGENVKLGFTDKIIF